MKSRLSHRRARPRRGTDRRPSALPSRRDRAPEGPAALNELAKRLRAPEWAARLRALAAAESFPAEEFPTIPIPTPPRED